MQRLGAQSETEKRLSALAAVKHGDDVTAREQLARLEDDVRQQDLILAGYEKDNERLRGDMKQLRATSKANEERMFHENHKLKAQLANLQSVSTVHSTHTTHLSSVLTAVRTSRHILSVSLHYPVINWHLLTHSNPVLCYHGRVELVAEWIVRLTRV